MSYAELQVTTHYSFLRGASSPEELFAAAAALGITALGIVDRNSLAGIVRAHEAAKATGVRLIVGCRLDLQCGTSLRRGAGRPQLYFFAASCLVVGMISAQPLGNFPDVWQRLRARLNRTHTGVSLLLKGLIWPMNRHIVTTVGLSGSAAATDLQNSRPQKTQGCATGSVTERGTISHEIVTR
jgi:hypothetical protein